MDAVPIILPLGVDYFTGTISIKSTSIESGTYPPLINSKRNVSLYAQNNEPSDLYDVQLESEI